MKVPLSWLGEYFVGPLDAFEVAERLTLAGIEVEQVQAIGVVDSRVVVAEVEAIEPIAGSGARVLSLRADRRREVVTTLSGLEVGQRVALALPGATLFDGASVELREIEAGEVYGKQSEGALASAADLGIGSDATRPLDVPGGVPGRPVAEYTSADGSRADRVLHLSIVPNIARCQSMRGVAREVRAILGSATKPEPKLDAPAADQSLAPSIEAADACTALSVYSIDGVEVKPSPEWIQRRLVLAGMSPINNVVDASNYVMLELGQPTHPYDADRLPSRDLGVRRSRKGDRLLTLQQGESDSPLELPEGVPLIVSNDEPVAVAGVVGGRPTAIHTGTRRVLLESAAFELVAIRKSQQALKISTEASARFSRGVNPELPPIAVARLLQVLRESSPEARIVASGERSLGTPPPRRIELSERALDQSLGVAIGLEQAVACLHRVGLEATVQGDGLVAIAGNARQDIALPCDLIEEIARITGYDKIPETMPVDPIPEHAPDPLIVARESLRDALVRAGVQEIITYSLTSTEVEERLALSHPNQPRPAAIPILNPASAERSVLRTSLLPGLLEVAASNLRQSSSLRLFEIGPVFLPSGDTLPDERERAAFLVAGLSAEPSLYDREPRPADFFDAKGVLEEALSSLGLAHALSIEPTDAVSFRPGAVARVLATGRPAGVIGAVHPLVLRAFDLEAHAVFVAELELAVLLAGVGARAVYAEFDRLPSIDIDIACIVDDGVTAAAIRDSARGSAGALLREVEIFDVFRGPQIGESKKAIALRLRLNAGDRTLEMGEALAVRSAVTAALRERLGATIRE